MGRRWNRFKSAIYTRWHGLTELHARYRGARGATIAQPPLAPLPRPLTACRVGLLTTAGVHHVKQHGFDMVNPDGDASYRVIAGDVRSDELTITHDYYDHRAADRDLNCVFPLERLHELVRAGEVGGVAPRHVGMMGHILGAERRRLVAVTAQEVAALFRDDRVDAVLASPG